jgi:tripartite-type tricarboxylate transporter receptor subunit TctC
VPTLAELGYPDANLWSTFGVFAPASTPRAVVDALNAAFNAALADPELAQRLAAASNVSIGGPPEAFARHIARERDAARRAPK